MFSSTSNQPTPPNKRERINLYISSDTNSFLFNNKSTAPEIKFTKDMDLVIKNSTEKVIIFEDSKGESTFELASKSDPSNACVIIFPSNLEAGIYTYKLKENSDSLGLIEKLN